MPTLCTPDGRRYQTDEDAEATNPTLSHGYALDQEDPNGAQQQQQPARPRSRCTTPPATDEHADTPTVVGETTD